MTRTRFLTYWYTGAAVAGAIITIVAGLLLAIIATARSIQANARRIRGVAEEVVDSTRPIWNLTETNAISGRLLEGTKTIEADTSTLADRLEAPRTPGRRRRREA